MAVARLAWLALIAVDGSHALGVACHRAMPHPRRTYLTVMSFQEAAEIEAKRRTLRAELKKAKQGVQAAMEAQDAAAEDMVGITKTVQAAIDRRTAAQAAAEKAAAEVQKVMSEAAAAEAVVSERVQAVKAAKEAVASVQAQLDAASEELAAWEEDNPLEAVSRAAGGIGGEIAKDVGSAMGKALLTSLFGESKSEREARLARERETVTAQTAAADEERLKAEEAAREAAAAAQAAAKKVEEEEARLRAEAAAAAAKAAKAAAKAKALADAREDDERKAAEEKVASATPHEAPMPSPYPWP